MRSCLSLLALLGAIVAQPIVSAQNTIPNNSRPAAPPAAVPVAVPSGSGVGVAIPKDSKLVAGDEVSILIKEDQQPPWKTYVSDQGMVEIGLLGSVTVAGRDCTDAASIISAYLRKDYYRQATVQVQILKKAEGAVPFFKVTIAGKVNRPGRQQFTEADPLMLSEAVVGAGQNEWSNLRKVSLTRGGQTREVDVEAITKHGRVELDVKLKDGDRIYVPPRGWIPTGGN